MRGGSTSPGCAVEGAAGELAEEEAGSRHRARRSAGAASRRGRRRSARRPALRPPCRSSGSSSMSRTDDAHGASIGSRLVIRIIVPGTLAVASRPSRSTRRRVGPVQVLDQDQASASDAAACASHATRVRERLLAQRECVDLGAGPPFVGLEPEQRGHQGQGVLVEAGVVEAGLQLGEPLLGRLAGVEAEELLEHAPDRPQRDVAVIRRAVGLEDGATLESARARRARRPAPTCRCRARHGAGRRTVSLGSCRAPRRRGRGDSR